MHLPLSIQYFVIGANDHQMVDFYDAMNAIYNNFGIRINAQPISLEPCYELVKTETSRNFFIFLRSECMPFRIKSLTMFNELFAKSPCNHKLALLPDDKGYDDIGRQIYYNLLGSLNLVYVFTRDGYLKTHGIQMLPEDSPMKSTLISPDVDPIPVEIVNIQPIILDMTRCGVLKPVLYFVASDFGTCIGQILLPGSSTWSLAYFIQCDDSGRKDLDMVKVCLVNEEVVPAVTDIADPTPSPLELKDPSVLNNPEYPFCRELATLLYDLNHLSPDLNVVAPINKKIKSLMVLCNANDGSIFPDAVGPLEIKKKYAKLYKEINLSMEKIRDRRAEGLKDSLKAVRKMINVLCVYIKRQSTKETPKSAKSPIKEDYKWIADARKLASHQSRTSAETKQTRLRRLEHELKDGIITMPLLEPYLDIKWPEILPPVPCDNPIIKEYCKAMQTKEEVLLINKRFGL